MSKDLKHGAKYRKLDDGRVMEMCGRCSSLEKLNGALVAAKFHQRMGRVTLARVASIENEIKKCLVRDCKCTEFEGGF